MLETESRLLTYTKDHCPAIYSVLKTEFGSRDAWTDLEEHYFKGACLHVVLDYFTTGAIFTNLNGDTKAAAELALDALEKYAALTFSFRGEPEPCWVPNFNFGTTGAMLAVLQEEYAGNLDELKWMLDLAPEDSRLPYNICHWVMVAKDSLSSEIRKRVQ